MLAEDVSKRTKRSFLLRRPTQNMFDVFPISEGYQITLLVVIFIVQLQ